MILSPKPIQYIFLKVKWNRTEEIEVPQATSTIQPFQTIKAKNNK